MFLPYIDMNPPRVYMCSPSWTPLLPASPSHPSESSQCTSPQHPVSCIEPGLAIHFTYDNIHVSVPSSQIIPSSPSPTESKRRFYILKHTHTQESLSKSKVKQSGPTNMIEWERLNYRPLPPILKVIGIEVIRDKFPWEIASCYLPV